MVVAADAADYKGGGEKGSYVQKATKKELPKEFSFLFLLECVVQFDAPGVVGIIYMFINAGSFGCEVVVSVQFYAFLECYACAGYPEGR